jgi:inosine-uridine nucleoside N-ribohydrolase
LRWVAQGGFAGDNVVPKEFRMKKFDGMVECPTYNFGGDPKSALSALNSKQIDSIMLVSKNVCHSVVYDITLHLKMKKLLKERKNNEKETGLDLLVEGMEIYLKKKGEKKFHDPLAAMCMLNPSICKFEKVTLEKNKNNWSSKLSKNSNTEISISVDIEAFENELMKLE